MAHYMGMPPPPPPHHQHQGGEMMAMGFAQYPHFQQQQQQQQQHYWQLNGHQGMEQMDPNRPQGFFTSSMPIHHSQPYPQHQHQQMQQQQHQQMPLAASNAHNVAGPSSSAQTTFRWQDESSIRMSTEPDWPAEDDEEDDDSVIIGGVHRGTIKDAFSCPHCDKIYRGKHARSIWRRHLQDKHGIPLSVQPRRTRWDADANRPKNAEERRERMLESKRRWARKKRAMDKADGKAVKSEDGDSLSPMPPQKENEPVKPEAAAAAGPSQSRSKQTAKASKKSSNAVLQPAQAVFTQQVPTRAVFDASVNQMEAPSQLGNFGPSMGMSNGNNAAWPAASSSSYPQRQPQATMSTLQGAFASPPRRTKATPDRRQALAQSSIHASSDYSLSPTSIRPTANGSNASGLPMPIASTPSRLSSQSMGRHKSSGSVSGASNPFSLDHHRISPAAPAKTTTLRSARGSTSSIRDSPHHPSRLLSRAMSANVLADLDASPTRPSPPSSSSMRRVLPPLVGTPLRALMGGKDDSMFLLGSASRGVEDSALKSPSSRGNLASSWRSRNGFHRRSSEDEDASSSLLSGGILSSVSRSRSSRSGKGGDFDDAGFDDSGICLTDMATPFHKSIGRQTMGLGAATPNVSSDLGDFPRTVGRPTPLRRSNRRARGQNNDDEDDDEDVGADQFSSPRHSSLAHTLGLAPQSALRSSTRHRSNPSLGGGNGISSSSHANGNDPHGFIFDFSSTNGGPGPSPFQHHSIMGLSLGFTPWEKTSSLNGNNPGFYGSPAANRGAQNISGRRSSGFGSALGAPIGDWPESVRRPLSSTRQNRGLGDDEGEQDGSVKRKLKASLHASHEEEEEEDKENETPSRPSTKRARKQQSYSTQHHQAKASTDSSNGSTEDDDDNAPLMPLRFGALNTTTAENKQQTMPLAHSGRNKKKVGMVSFATVMGEEGDSAEE